MHLDSKERRGDLYHIISCRLLSDIIFVLVAIKTVDAIIGNQAFNHDRCNIVPGLSCK